MTYEALVRFATDLSAVIERPVKVVEGKAGMHKLEIAGWGFFFTADDEPGGGYDGWDTPPMKPKDLKGRI
jgi:hypothetical protein